MRAILLLLTFSLSSAAYAAEPLPIDPLWKSETFRKSITAGFGIDSRIEPRITEDEAFYLEKMATSMAANDRAAAIKTLTDSSLLADSAAMLFNLASLQFEEGKRDEALKGFITAIEKFPNFRDAHRNLAVVYVQLEDFEKAKTHLVRALELGSQDSLTAGLLGYCHARDEYHQAALDAYRLALLTAPDERQWRLGEAQSLEALGQSKAAATIYQSLITDAPAETNAWLTQADAWIALNEPLKAIVNLELVHRSGALDPTATLSLGHLYVQSSLPGLALDRYRSAILAKEPVAFSRAVEALEMLSNSADWTRAKELADLIAASQAYQATLIAPDIDRELASRLTRSRALIELENGDADAGSKLVEEWLAQEPLDGHALLLLARFREEKGQLEEAVMLLEQAENLPEVAADAHLAHGRLLVGDRQYAAAVEQLEKSYEQSPVEAVAEYLEAVRELQ